MESQEWYIFMFLFSLFKEADNISDYVGLNVSLLLLSNSVETVEKKKPVT